MSLESKFLAVGLSTAIVLGVTADTGNPEVLHVGDSQWVQVTEPITQHYTNGDEYLRPGDECLLVRGATLVLRGADVVYVSQYALGTECPNGAEIAISEPQAKAQDRTYQAFEERKDQIVHQLSALNERPGPLELAPDDWVTLVNPKPVEQRFTNGSEKIGYGDTCFADGMVMQIGTLTTGESVMLVINSAQRGTECPTGALYLTEGAAHQPNQLPHQHVDVMARVTANQR